MATTGSPHTYWQQITVNAGESWQYTATGHPGVVSIAITVCDSSVGIVDAPDPVITVAPPTPVN